MTTHATYFEQHKKGLTMSYYLKNGNTYRVTDKAALDIHEHLPAGNYIIKQDMFHNFFLEQIDNFTMPGKLYGSTTKNADRILRTFESRDASTGVMLNGEKGSGKTLLAKTLAIYAAEKNIPTIVINHPWHGDEFNKLIQDIEQPCVVLFDEFEKVYDRDQQESILTLLDGVFPSKKLFVITCNDKYRVDQHMRNRPGRIFYMLDFKGLEQDFIVEYCNDTLKNKTHIDTICKIATMFSEFNFDMLKALIEEMNRYNESPQESMSMLNAKPEFSEAVKYDVQMFVDNKLIEDRHVSPSKWKGNPLSQNSIDISWYDESDENEDNHEWESVDLTQNDLQKIEPQAGRFVFANGNCMVVLTREREKLFDYYGAF